MIPVTASAPHTEAEDPWASGLELLEQVARQASRSTHVDGAAVSMIDADDPRVLKVVATEGDGDVLEGQVFASDAGLTGQVCSTGECVVAAPGEQFDVPGAGGPASGLRAVAAAPIVADGRVVGAVTMLSDSPVDDQAEVLQDLDDLSSLASAAVQSTAGMESREQTLSAGVGALGTLLDLRDGCTWDHSEEVVELCAAIGRRMGFTAGQLDVLNWAARLHDLGKIGVPDDILHKPGPLTGEEWKIMRCHPVWGEAALASIPDFAPVAQAVRGHHERWDGEGYPDGLATDQIPLSSRIITVSDAYQAMTSNRPYRAALDTEEAMRRMLAGAGSQFDPAVIEAFTEVLASDWSPPQDEHQLRPEAPPAGGRFVRSGQSRGGGAALAAALAQTTRLPALKESRERLLGLLEHATPDPQELIAVIESDIALTVSVLRAAARVPGAGEVCGVPAAVRHLGTAELRDTVHGVAAIDFFERLPGVTAPAEHFRLHALATKQAAERLTADLQRDDRDEILVAALLHDVGKLVLEQAYDAYPEQILGEARTPDARVDAERHQMGMDHALLGGVLLRRWKLPERLTGAVEHHHDPDATGPAAVVRLADMLAHYTHARPVDPRAVLGAAHHLGLSPTHLRGIMFDLSQAASAPTRATQPSPLSPQEEAVLRGLATGKVYKEIAKELNIAASTVRTHSQSIYRKLDVIDRANAVLTATDNGWI